MLISKDSIKTNIRMSEKQLNLENHDSTVENPNKRQQTGPKLSVTVKNVVQ